MIKVGLKGVIMKSILSTLFIGLTLAVYPTLYAQTADNKIIDAYVYGFPLVLMDVTKNVLTNTPSLKEHQAPINQFLNKRTFPDATFKEVVSPNADTLYSQAWLDLSKEPIVLSVPDMGNRYYLFPMLDAWTNVFFSPGTRTTGNKKNNFAIIGPHWNGQLPKDVQAIKSSTNLVWILGRIQTNGPSDYKDVNQLQDQFKLTPLHAWGTNYILPTNLPVNTAIDTTTAPIEQVLKMDGATFFKRLSLLLKDTAIPLSDSSYIKSFSDFGFIAGKEFDTATLSPQQIESLNIEIKKAQEQIKENWDQHPFAKTENGWGVILKDIGQYGTNYELRAAVAYGGLGANLPEDAIYPATNVDSNGELLNGKFNYIIHFNKGSIPPVNAFWSLTMYNEKHFFVPNSINRYAIGSKDHLKLNEDGSLNIYIQNESPSKDKESNWLPAPKGDFNLILRLYWPKKEILDGNWKPPEVKKLSKD